MPKNFIFDRYADATIGGQSEQFDAIEIHNVPTYFSVFLHYKHGNPQGFEGLQCAGDFTRRADAVTFANELSKKYGWPVYDRATNEPRAWERMTDVVLLDGAKKDDLNAAIAQVAEEACITDLTIATGALERYTGSWQGLTASLRVQALEQWQMAERLANRDYEPVPEVEQEWMGVLRAVLPYAQSRAEDLIERENSPTEKQAALNAWEAVRAAHKLLGTKS